MFKYFKIKLILKENYTWRCNDMRIGRYDIEMPAILMILLGLIALMFPASSTHAIGIIMGIVFVIIAVLLLISGAAEFVFSRGLSLTSFIIAILCLIFSYFLMVSPAAVSIIVSVIIYLLGIIMLIGGIFNLATGRFFQPFSAIGITGIVFGILFLVIGIFVRSPAVLGVIVGLWLIISGILAIFADNDKGYIDV